MTMEHQKEPIDEISQAHLRREAESNAPIAQDIADTLADAMTNSSYEHATKRLLYLGLREDALNAGLLHGPMTILGMFGGACQVAGLTRDQICQFVHAVWTKMAVSQSVLEYAARPNESATTDRGWQLARQLEYALGEIARFCHETASVAEVAWFVITTGLDAYDTVTIQSPTCPHTSPTLPSG